MSDYTNPPSGERHQGAAAWTTGPVRRPTAGPGLPGAGPTGPGPTGSVPRGSGSAGAVPAAAGAAVRAGAAAGGRVVVAAAWFARLPAEQPAERLPTGCPRQLPGRPSAGWLPARWLRAGQLPAWRSVAVRGFPAGAAVAAGAKEEARQADSAGRHRGGACGHRRRRGLRLRALGRMATSPLRCCRVTPSRTPGST